MSDVQQVVSKVKPNCTYTNTANYWAPLADKDNDDGYNEAAPAQKATINNISNVEVQRDLRSTIMAWINQCMSKHKPFQWKASTMVVDSGATSSIVWPEENLPITGLSSKVVNLPDGSAIQATHTTMLPFKSLSDEARKSDVIPRVRHRWKDVTYAKFVCELKPNKAEVHQTRLTVGGDKVHYPGNVGTPTADLMLVKMNVNSVISTQGA
jgi:hypothetical protein